MVCECVVLLCWFVCCSSRGLRFEGGFGCVFVRWVGGFVSLGYVLVIGF